MPDSPITPAPDLNAMLESAGQGPVKPTSTSAKKPVAPVQPELQTPYFKQEADEPGISALMGQLDSITSKFSQPLPQLGKVNFSNPDVVDQFTSQKTFNADGFDPTDFESNNQRFAAKEDWSSVLSKTIDDFGYKFKGSFLGNFETYGQLGSALFNLDMSKLELSDDEKLSRYQQDNYNEQVNHIFQTPEEDDKFFNKQFFKDIVGNSGFALGTFAAFGLELGIDAGLEAVTFGGATPLVAADAMGLGSKLIRGAQRLGEGFKLADKTSEEIRAGAKLASEFDEAFDAARGLKQMGNAGSKAGERTMSHIWDNLSNFTSSEKNANALYQNAGKLFGHLPVLGTLPKYASRMAAASAAGEDVLKVAGIGLAGFRRSLTEFNMAASEASFEGITTYGDTLDGLVSNYRVVHNGEAPGGEELKQMRAVAGQASSANYKTNMALLLVSNKLQFGNMFSGFSPANKLMRDLVEESEGDILRVSGKLLGKETEKEVANQFGKEGTRLYQKGFFGSYGAYNKIAAEFGRKEAVYQMAKTFGKDALRFELGEGLQENAQETSASGWKNYYLNAYQGSQKTLMQAMGEGAKEQLTQQGVKTFLMGALTGSIIHGVTAPAGKGLQQLQDLSYGKENSPLVQARSAAARDVATLNSYFKDPGKFVFNPQQLLFNQQVQASSQMSEAAAQGKKYEWHNAKENSLLSIAAAARRVNSVEALTKQLQQVGETFDETQFKEAFGIDLKDTSHTSISAFTTKLASDIKAYVEEIDKVKLQVGPVLDTSKMKAGSAQQLATNLYNASMEQAVETIALNKIKGNLTAVRLQQVNANLAKIEGMGEVSDWILRSSTTYEGHLAEMGQVAQDIARTKKEIADVAKSKADQANAGITYDAELHQKLERQLSQKQDLYEVMKTWRGFFAQPKDQASVPGETDEERTNRLAALPYEFVGVDNILDHEDVSNTFAKLVNERIRMQNPETARHKGIGWQSTLDGFSNVVDYIRLSRDLQDYRDAVDQISRPQDFIKFHARVMEGRWKAGIALNLEAIMSNLTYFALKETGKIDAAGNILKSELEAFENSEEFTSFKEAVQQDAVVLNLQAIQLNPHTTYASAQYAGMLIDLLPSVIDSHLKAVFKMAPAIEEITPEEPTSQEPSSPESSEVEAEDPVNDSDFSEEEQRLRFRLAGLLIARIKFAYQSSDPEAISQAKEDGLEVQSIYDTTTLIAPQEQEDLKNKYDLEIGSIAQQHETAGRIGEYAAYLNQEIDAIYQQLGAEQAPEENEAEEAFEPEAEEEGEPTVVIGSDEGTGMTITPEMLRAMGIDVPDEAPEAPETPEVVVVPTSPTEANVVDEAGNTVVEGATPEAATKLAEITNDITATLLLAQQEDLLGKKYTPELGNLFYERAAAIFPTKTPFGRMDADGPFKSVIDYYNRGGKTILRKLAKELKKEVTEAPLAEAPAVVLPSTEDPASSPVLFTTELQSIASITPALFDEFRAQLESILAPAVESSAESRNFEEPGEVTPAPTESDAMNELFSLLECTNS